LPRALFFSKRFAAKEAFAKAIGLGIGRGIDFLDIEVENNELGKPQIKILNNKEEFLKKHFNCKNFVIHLSLTDENPLAGAYVIIEKIS
jgi:holo-[acyl-carrier protein] synthase